VWQSACEYTHVLNARTYTCTSLHTHIFITCPMHTHTFITHRSDGKVWQSRMRTDTHSDKQWIDYFDQEDKKPKPRGKVVIDGELVHGLNERAEVCLCDCVYLCVCM
jgi:hypothetical protein